MCKRSHAITLAALAALPWVAEAEPPALLPVQGYLTDAGGAPINGSTAITFAIYDVVVGGAALHLEQQTVSVDRGTFTAYLGAGTTNLSLGIFTARDLWLGIAVGADPEMTPRFRLGTAPFAAFAQLCADAETLGGLAPADYAPAAHGHDFSALSNIPAGLGDGDNDTTYTAGTGLVLTGTQFNLSQTVVEGLARGACFDSEAELTASLNDNYAAAAHTQAWSSLTGVPAGLADGVDNDTTYSAGPGLNLAGTVFSVSGVTGAMVSDGSLGSTDIQDGSLIGADLASGTTLNVARVQYSAPRTHWLVIGEARFRGRLAATQVSCCTGSGGAYISNAATDAMTAVVDLPTSAVITQMTVYYLDNEATLNLRMELYEHNLMGNYSAVESFTTSGQATAVRSSVVDVSPDFTVNASGSLTLSIYAANGTALAAWPGNTLRMFGAAIEYTVAEAE